MYVYKAQWRLLLAEHVDSRENTQTSLTGSVGALEVFWQERSIDVLGQSEVGGLRWGSAWRWAYSWFCWEVPDFWGPKYQY